MKLCSIFAPAVLTAFLGMAACSSTRTDYSEPVELAAEFKAAFDAGKQYAIDTKTLPPVPGEVYVKIEQMMAKKGYVYGYVDRAHAMLDGGLQGLKENHPEVYAVERARINHLLEHLYYERVERGDAHTHGWWDSDGEVDGWEHYHFSNYDARKRARGIMHTHPPGALGAIPTTDNE